MCLAFLKARHDIRFMATHIWGEFDMLADALCRNSLLKFFFLIPTGQPTTCRHTILTAGHAFGVETRLDITKFGGAVEFYFWPTDSRFH